MQKSLISATVVLVIVFAAIMAAYSAIGSDWLETTAISVGVTLYHFAMRLLVGLVYHAIFRNRVNYNLMWFRQLPSEQKLYKFLRVKKWKKIVPTFRPDFFDLEKHSAEEIVGAVCEAELVHETIVPLSFLPVLLIPQFGAAAVFWITSSLAAAMDITLVIVQRYNRPRLLKLLRKQVR